MDRETQTAALEPAPRLNQRRRGGLVAAVCLLVLVADIATKTWAAQVLVTDPISLLGGALVLTEGRNPGAAFEMGTSLTPLLSALAVAVVIGLGLAARRPHAPAVAVALGLGLGGAAGNAADRLFRSPGPMRGHVVDWIDIGDWPTFNIADAALMSGCALVVATWLLAREDGSAAARRGLRREADVS